MPSTLLQQDIINRLRADCGEFIKHSIPLYRGADFNECTVVNDSTSVSEVLIKKLIRQGRQARDMSQNMNDMIDRNIEPIIGFKPRSHALFATTDKGTASLYGDVYLVFPIGTFKFAYSPYIDDMLSIFDGSNWPADFTILVSGILNIYINDSNIGYTLNHWKINAFRLMGWEYQQEFLTEVFETLGKELFEYKDFSSVADSNGAEVMINGQEYYLFSTELIQKIFNCNAEDFMCKL